MAKKRRQSGGDYTVGYGKTPLHTRYSPGQSGNPGGRPAKAAAAEALPPGLDRLSEATLRILSETVTLRVGGRNLRVSGEEAILLAQRQRAMEGDLRSARFLLARGEDARAQADRLRARSSGNYDLGERLAALSQPQPPSCQGSDSVDADMNSELTSLPGPLANPPADTPLAASEASPVGEEDEAEEPLPDLPDPCGHSCEPEPSDGRCGREFAEAVAGPASSLPPGREPNPAPATAGSCDPTDGSGDAPALPDAGEYASNCATRSQSPEVLPPAGLLAIGVVRGDQHNPRPRRRGRGTLADPVIRPQPLSLGSGYYGGAFLPAHWEE